MVIECTVLRNRECSEPLSQSLGLRHTEAHDARQPPPAWASAGGSSSWKWRSVTAEDAARAALRDEVFPTLLTAAGVERHADALRALLRLAVAGMASARGLALPSDLLRTPQAFPAAALEAASRQVASLDLGAASVRLPGLLYTDLLADRHGWGSYYTPPDLASWVARRTVGLLLPPEGEESFIPSPARSGMPRILDPAMGSGHFLIAAAEVIAARLSGPSQAESRWRAARCLYGIDRDRLAVDLARAALWLWVCEGDSAAPPVGRRADLWADLRARLVCADALLDDPFPGGFDAVLGNPPFASVFTRAQSPDGDARQAIQARYPTATGSFDLAVPFVERAMGLCRNGGRVGLVLPNKLLAADYARSLRIWLSKRAVVEAILDASRSKAFEASVYPVAVVLCREQPQAAAPLVVFRAGERLAAPEVMRRGRQADLHTAPGAVWSAALDPAWDALHACFEGGIPLGDAANLSAGLTVAEAYHLRPRVVDVPLGVLPPDAVRLVTSGLIERHRCRWGAAPARFLNRRYRCPAIMLHALPPRRREQALAPKLVISGLGLRPRAFLDRGLTQASVATTIITSDGWPLGALCAVLNSSLAARLYRALFGGLALGGGYLRFGKRELARLPLPDVPAHDPRLAHLDALAAAMPGADPVARADLDAQIDALVGALYGLDQDALG